MSTPEVRVTTHELKTADGARIAGVLRTAGDGRGPVVSIMHPRQDVTHHPLIPSLLAEGVSVWTQGSRSVNNDLALVHEQTLLDVAAGQSFVAERGFGTTITLGHSGGGTLYAYYQQQALTPPRERYTASPSGVPVDLPGATMPVPDLTIFLAPHPGQGVLLERLIDASVTDESDPLSVDPGLDPFDPANGFREPPEQARYSPEFVERYRAGQRARIRRIDAVALAHVEARRAAEEHAADPASRRAADTVPVIPIYRTDADLRSVDLSIDPNERLYGSLFGRRPHRGNYQLPGFARVVTPASWLSTWSANHSRANFVRNVTGVVTPTLLIELTGDQACFPADASAMHAALAATDKTHVRVAGQHFGQAMKPGGPTGIALAAEQIHKWLLDRK
ncbi:hypothetical protein Asp14428_18520 [Actinoplanes sp. NBRC 14428]|uniref:Alpha/beta hydrolase family protein n=1 Tax=Pseudosporangium ferrugineum TaxID=439699 RepID=A0A2T0SBM4_9ACTN|nr:alpha/beta hydrolase [Pseudosporangium ferrugineum]PRY30818.1 hypothetical protein CLV70_104370 [Pseudosporangium ferrugineum]BCJ50377.1 hypothetical protein Asp14428_18520 [Actinoplanes sp. NBRC 14428]